MIFEELSGKKTLKRGHNKFYKIVIITKYMSELNLEIPEDLEFIKKMPKIDWSLLVSKIIESKLNKISEMKKNLSKSALTEKDVEELSDNINESLSKKYIK